MSDLIYRLVLRARFESEEELEKAIRGLDRLQIQGSKINVNIGDASRRGAMGLEQLASAALRVGFMFNMLESAYMRVTMGQLMVERGQDRLNKTVQKFGANSEEARTAAEQLEQQMMYLNMANTRANVSMALLLLQFALQTNLLKKATLAQAAHTAATVIDTAKTWLHNAALSAKATLLSIISPLSTPARIAAAVVIGGTIAGVGGGMAISQAVQPAPKNEINIETNITTVPDLEEAFNEAKRQATYELRR